MRDGADTLACPISVLINKIIDSGSVPAAWKLAEICPIFKKDNPHDVKSNFRPVSILVSLDKVFEKCLARQQSLIILDRSCHHSYLRTDGVTAVRRYFYV